MWGFPHVNLGVVMARRTIEVRKPRDIGDAIRAVREARGISQEDLAQAPAAPGGSASSLSGLTGTPPGLSP